MLKKLSKMLSQMLGTSTAGSNRNKRRERRFRPGLETLEDRTNPSVMFTPQLVANSNFQNFSVNNGQLTVNGDQRGYGYSDTITIDVNAAHGVWVNLNGQVASYGYGQIRSIVVNTGAGSNSVYVNNEAENVPLTINDGGNDYVHVGSNGNAQGIRGEVSINNPFSYTNLVIDDSADTYHRAAYVNSTYVAGLAYSAINFHYNDLSYLTIYGGSGGNTFNVFNTPSTYTGSYAGYTWIRSGTGSDDVNVYGTAGGAYAGGLYIDGQSGYDNVYVGGDSWSWGRTGSLANINGFVYAYNASGATHLFVDDSGDHTSHTATLNSSSLTGLSAGTVYWAPTASFTGGVTYLEINGSAAGSTYNVTDTPNLYYYTNLDTGSGSDTVNITGTTGFVTTNNRGGCDSVYVGNGTLAGINGSVYAYGAGSTYLYIQDANDTAHTRTLSSNYLMGLSTGVIWWAPSSTAMGGVTYLSVAGSPASIFNVTDTPNFLYYTDLYSSPGSQVNINGTTGTLNVITGGGRSSIYVGNGTLANINGAVNVSGTSSTYLYVQDSNDTTARTATLTRSSLTGLSRGAIQWVASSSRFGGVTFVDVWGSAAGSTYYVTDTPNLYYSIDLNTGNGNDSVFITATTSPLYLNTGDGSDTVVIGSQAPATSGGTPGAINGFVDVSGVGTIALTVDDSGDTTGRSATLSSNSLAGLSPALIYYETNVASLTINGGSGDDTLTVASTSSNTTVTFNGGNGSNTLVGANTFNGWDVSGTNAGNLAGIVNFANVGNLVGGTAVDSFRFEVGGSVVSMDGGGAPAGQGDWLDYTGYPAAVSVNLATGRATGVSGTVSNIQNVFGGNFGNTLVGNAQGNILIGGDGADTLIGGSGRSLLIGGKGDDTISGGAGDDVVIGGYTTYRSPYHESVLMDLFARWQSADSYEARISTLRSTWRPLSPGKTVLDDGGHDQLSGGAGQDWFIVGINGTLTDRQAGEAIN